MLILENSYTGTSGETAISAYDIQVSETLGSLSTLSFNFVETLENEVGTAMLVPRTIVTEAVTGQKYRLLTAEPTPNNKKRIWQATAIQVGNDLSGHYVEKRLEKTQSLENCMKLIVRGTKFSYVIHDDFKNYSFSEGFGANMASEMLSQCASDFGFEYYFDNYTIHIYKSVGKTSAFLFVDGANVAKIVQKQNYEAIKTHIKGYAGKPDEKTGKYPIEAEYTSPLAESPTNWGIIDAEPYTNENMKRPALKAKLKQELHDYPDVEYTVSSISFDRSLPGFKNDSTVGNYGYLRDRYGIDVSVRVQSRSYYPQEPKRLGSITFGNKIFSSDVLETQNRRANKLNVKLGKTMQKGLNDTSQKAQQAWNARLVVQSLSSRKKEFSTKDEKERYVLTMPADNPSGLPEGTALPLDIDATDISGLQEAIETSQAAQGVATEFSNGQMSAEDKRKLNNLKMYGEATTTQAGVMSPIDKRKLDGLQTEPVNSVQIKDTQNGVIYKLTVQNGEINLRKV